MGKITGFMEYQRKNAPHRDPEERICDFLEFRQPLSHLQRREQAARCMNCGVPFCQSGVQFGGMFSGCPLHNLIPEWNDEVYNGNYPEALSRLRKTNNFPEFTGRVCPALCEAACTCGLNGDSVCIRDNELAIIEAGFEQGLVRPEIPALRSGKRVAVVGSGPSGLAAADQLNRRGHSVTVLERERKPGGLLQYGIPNMKLDKKVVARRIALMEAEGVTFRTGVNVGVDLPGEALLEEFDAVILCCGAKKPRDLVVPGREARGVEFAVDYLTAATKAVTGETAEASITAKGRDVVVVGGGDTGNDCVGTAIRQGCRSVCQLEMMGKLPTERAPQNPWPQWPRICKTDYGQEEAVAVFGSDPRRYETTVKEILAGEDGAVNAIRTVKLAWEKQDGRSVCREIPGSEQTVPCSLLLIAAGFTGCEDYVAEAFSLPKTSRGTLADRNYQTETPNLFTAGDARRGQSLVVWAIAEGRACAQAVDEYLMDYRP